MSRVLKVEPSRDDFGGDDVVVEDVAAKQFSAPLVGQRVAFVDDELVREAFDGVVGHRLEKPECVRVRKVAVFFESLSVVSALNVMKPASVAAVVAGKNAAFAVDFEAIGIAAALGENLEPPRTRLVSPDELAHPLDRLGIAFFQVRFDLRPAIRRGCRPGRLGTRTAALTVLPWAP